MAFHKSQSQDEAWFTDEGRVGLASLWRACEPRVAGLVELAQVALAALERTSAPSGGLASGASIAPPGASTPGWRERMSAEVLSELRLALDGETQPFARTLTRYACRLARREVSLERVFGVLRMLRERVVQLLIEQYASAPRELEGALFATQRLWDFAQLTVTRAYFDHREQLVEDQRRSKDAALLRFTRLYEAGVLGIMVCDLSGHIKEANDAFLDMVGYARDELLSGAVRWSDLTPPEWRASDEQAVAQLRTFGRTGLRETEYIRKDGSRVATLFGAAMLHGSDCVAFVLDISERKHAEELRTRSIALEAENQRIQEASRLKSEFLANMSHELRTPLNSIIGFADLLYDGEISADRPEHREFLGDILKSGRHLLQLINDVLDLAKIEAGKMEFRPEETDLARLLAEVVDVLRSIAQDNRVEVSQQVDAELDRIVIDPARLKQVLYNYLSNALKFTPPGGRVAVRALSDGPDHFRVEVEDTGIGIAEDDVARLFLEFEQLDHGRQKRHAGTGLGLALTKRIVQAQGGTVGVRSEPSRGSVFWARLPTQAAGQAEPIPSVLPERFDDAPLILVVDDDTRDRQLIVRMLNTAGYGVEVASSGAQAIAACRKRVYDAITLDLILPDISGLDVLQRIRAEGMNRDTPVVIASVVEERGVVQGIAIHDFLQKPIEPSRLLASLQRAGLAPERQRPILVVDDDPAALKLMDTTLRKLGYRVECRADAQSALAQARGVEYEAVILDLLMPGIDGFEFLTRFRSRPEHRTTPVFVWTVKDLTIDDRLRLQQNVQAVFAKGSGRPQNLADELRSLVQRRPDTAEEMTL